MRIIYDLCAGEVVEEKLIIDLQSIEFSSYGLMKYYSLDIIFNSLILLSPYFCNHQHLVGHALVFHLLKISLSLDLNLSKSTSLQCYLKDCCLREVQDLFTKMWKLIEALKQSSNYIEFNKAMLMETPLMNKKINMSNFIQKMITDKEKISLTEIHFIAKEISELSRGFYQKAPLDLLISDSSNMVFSNPFIKKVGIANELTAYILCKILWQNSELLRAKAIQLFVLVAKESFLHGPDLNSLLTIMTALASPRISRLKKTWDFIAKKMPKTKEIYDLLMKWLSDELDGNYKQSRRLMERYPTTLPYLGFNFRENILIGENPNKANNLFYLGKLYHYLMNLKAELEFVFFTNETNLFDELINLAIPNEDSFIKMSYWAEPEILDLVNCSVEQFLTNLKRSQEYGLSLKIMSNTKYYEGPKALAIIFNWLKKFENDPNFNEEFLYAHYKNCKNKEELFSSLYNDCKNFVDNDIDMSEKAKKGSFKRLSIFSNSSPLLLSNTEKINDKEKSITPRTQ